MIKHISTICMVLLLPAVVGSLLMSLLFNETIDWEYIYLMSIFSLVVAMITASTHEKKNRITETKFNYIASVPSGPVIFLLFILVFNLTITVEGLEKESWVIRIAVIAAIILLSFLKFKFYIEENSLTYEILLFTILIHKRKIYPDEVKNVKFVRTGWAKKGAIIKVKKGFNIRIINFEPRSVCPDLNKFTEKHSISISKTYDYMILDKSSRRQSL